MRKRQTQDVSPFNSFAEGDSLIPDTPPYDAAKSRRKRNFCYRLIRSLIRCVGVLIILCGIGLVAAYNFLPSPIDPQLYSFPDPPSLVGPLAPNTKLQNAEIILRDKLVGPESLIVGPDSIFTGTSDGRIVEIVGGKVVKTVRLGREPCVSYDDEPTCGRPLGMRLSKRNHLLVADAYLGLFRINWYQDKVERLVDGGSIVDGRPLRFLNDVELLADETILFTDSSSNHQRRNFINVIFEHKPDGRLLSYNPYTKKVSVLLDGLYFPNGIQLSSDKKFLFLAELTKARILKYHLEGEDRGKVEVFVDNLPGLPDNIRLSSNGSLWFGYYRFPYKVDEHSLLIIRAPSKKKTMVKK